MLAVVATCFVVATGRAEGLGWIILGFFTAWVYVLVVPELFRGFTRRIAGQRVAAGLPRMAERIGAALSVLPGLAAVVGSHASTFWQVLYLILSVAGWCLLWRGGPDGLVERHSH